METGTEEGKEVGEKQEVENERMAEKGVGRGLICWLKWNIAALG